jgi:hypothetical protein
MELLARVLMKRAGETHDTRTGTLAKKKSGSAEGKKCKPRKSKGLDGRPVGTRTPDLYRVKVAL